MTISRKPWLDPTSPWSNEKQFLNWMRGELRKVWTHHPIKNNYVQSKRFKAPLGKPTKKEPDGKMVWAVQCELCDAVVKCSKPAGQRTANYNIDHIHGGKGFNDLESMMGWIDRTFYVTSDDIRILCTPCHKVVNMSQRSGLSFEDARIEKEAIRLSGLPISSQKVLLEEHGVTDHSNQKKRREAFRDLIKKELINRGEL